MTKATVEAKIHSLLLDKKSVDVVVEHLETSLDWRKLSRKDIESVCSFLTHAGYHGLLAKLLATNAQIVQHFPWPSFAEAVFHATSNIPDELKNTIIAGAVEDNSIEELSRSNALDHWDSFLLTARANREQNIKMKVSEARNDYLQQVELLKIQGLIDQEEKVLSHLLRLYPGDEEIHRMLLNCRERKSLDILSRRSTRKSRSRPAEKVDPQETLILTAIEESQKEQLSLFPQLAIDFSISHWTWDNPEAGLIFLENLSSTPSRDWLRLDLLLKAKMYVQILEETRALELRYYSDPDSLMTSLLYRAQALWGLDEKFQAMEILESICASHSDFRSAAILLAEMKENFE